METIKVSKILGEAICYLQSKMSPEAILKAHAASPYGWANRADPLNGLDYKRLKKILTHGYTYSTRDEARPTPKTPHQMGRIAPAVQAKPSEMALKAELDYELACLHDAIQQDDQIEVARSKQRLKEIREELEGAQ